MASISVSVFWAPPEQETLAHYAAAGITRAILALPSADRETILPRLDEYARLRGVLGQG